MNIVKKIKKRFSYLPNLRADNMAIYLAYKVLLRMLVRRNIMDDKGHMTRPRKNKPRFIRQEHGYSQLVSVGGFGWSGSSAVVDLLSEYDGVTVSSTGVSSDPSNQPLPCVPEFELARAAGGLFELEHVFHNHSFFERDAAIRIFAELAESLYLNDRSFYGEEFVDETRSFLDKLVFTRAENGGDGFDYCHHLSSLGSQAVSRFLGAPNENGKHYLFYLNDLSVSEYRKLAREYIANVLQYFKASDILVLDQATSDDCFDVKKYQEFFGPIKTIFVWRDPSEIYAASQSYKDHPEALFPVNPEEYAAWYGTNIRRACSVENKMWLNVRFEDLLFSYDREVKRIEEFLGLRETSHVRKGETFIPHESTKRSVGLWKSYPDQDAISIIRKSLSEFCFE